MVRPQQFSEQQFLMDFTKFENFMRSEYKGREHIPETFYPKAPFFIRHILWRRSLNMNSIILIVGGVRTGKSYMGLKIAECYCDILAKPFDVNKQCSFEIIPFLKWSQEATDSIFVLDEVGISLSPNEWFTVQSKIFRNFAQAQGFRRNVMILVLPNTAFLLKSIRFMCNYILETKSQGKGFVKKLIMDHTKGKGYIQNLGMIIFSLPRKSTIGPYEIMKKDWNDRMLKEDIEELLRSEEKKKFSNQIEQFPKEPVLKLGPNPYDQTPT